MSEFLWGAMPYLVLLDERNWTTKFHLGLFMAIGGHAIGILVPKFLTDGAGIGEHLYHIIALASGIPAGLLFFGGFFLLT